jgi:hypothetical protein
MKNVLLLLVAVWIFQPSTYSNRKPQAPRRQRNEQTETYTNRGFRQSRSTINVGGYVIDQTFLYESWSQKNE